MFSALDWVEESWTKTGKSSWHAEKKPTYMVLLCWKERAGTIAGTAHTQEYLLLHLAMFPIGLHTWCHVLGVPDAHQLQAQIIHRARKVLELCPITPAHRKPPWPGYEQGMRLFTKLLVDTHW